MLASFVGKTFGCASTCRQIGKSYAAVTYAISKCLQKPNQHVIYCAPTSKQVRGIAYKHMRSILASCPSEIYPHKTQEELYFKNGSILTLAGCHNRGDRLRGKTAELVVIDEARDIPAEDFIYILDSIIKPMLTTTGGSLIIVTTPPASADHPLCTEWIPKAIKDKSFFVATYKDNPLIEPDFLTELQAQDKGAASTIHFRREYLADYTTSDATRLVIPSFDPIQQKARLEEFNKIKQFDMKLEPWVGIDIGVRAKTALIFGLFDSLANILCVVGERILSNPSTKDIISAIISGEKEYFKNQLVEPVRITDIDLLWINDCRREYGIGVRQVVKQDKISMVARLDEAIRTGRTIVDINGAPYLAAQLKGGLWNDTRTDYEKSSDGSHMDALDALKYMEMSIIRTVYNRPKPEVHFAPTPYTAMPTNNSVPTLPLDNMRLGKGLPLINRFR